MARILPNNPHKPPRFPLISPLPSPFILHPLPLLCFGPTIACPFPTGNPTTKKFHPRPPLHIPLPPPLPPTSPPTNPQRRPSDQPDPAHPPNKYWTQFFSRGPVFCSLSLFSFFPCVGFFFPSFFFLLIARQLDKDTKPPLFILSLVPPSPTPLPTVIIFPTFLLEV